MFRFPHAQAGKSVLPNGQGMSGDRGIPAHALFFLLRDNSHRGDALGHPQWDES